MSAKRRLGMYKHVGKVLNFFTVVYLAVPGELNRLQISIEPINMIYDDMTVCMQIGVSTVFAKYPDSTSTSMAVPTFCLCVCVCI